MSITIVGAGRPDTLAEAWRRESGVDPRRSVDSMLARALSEHRGPLTRAWQAWA